LAAFEKRPTGTLPNRITDDEDNYKCSIIKAKPGLLLIETKSRGSIRRPAILPNRLLAAVKLLSRLLNFF